MDKAGPFGRGPQCSCPQTQSRCPSGAPWTRHVPASSASSAFCPSLLRSLLQVQMSQLILNIPQSIPSHLRGVASSFEHSSGQRPWVPAQNPTQVEHLLNQNFCSLYDIPIMSLSSREAHRRQELGLPTHCRPHMEMFNEGKETIIWARPTCIDV